jgi:hypothetical protein
VFLIAWWVLYVDELDEVNEIEEVNISDDDDDAATDDDVHYVEDEPHTYVDELDEVNEIEEVYRNDFNGDGNKTICIAFQQNTDTVAVAAAEIFQLESLAEQV